MGGGRPTALALLNDDDVAAMRRNLAPGQIWMRVDQFDEVRADWPAVESAARLQRAVLASPHGRSGRPRGRRKLNESERMFLESAGIDETTALTEVYRRGVAAGVWTADLRPMYDRRNLDRARSLLRRAGLRPRS